MAEPFDSQLVLVTPIWSFGSERAQVGYWFHDTTEQPLSLAQLQDIAGSIAGTIKVRLQLFHPTSVALVNTIARQYRTDGTQVVGENVVNNYTGTKVDTILPAQ